MTGGQRFIVGKLGKATPNDGAFLIGGCWIGIASKATNSFKLPKKSPNFSLLPFVPELQRIQVILQNPLPLARRMPVIH